MIVSLLQLMGLSKREPVHSRAEEGPADKPARARSRGAVLQEHAQASPARRQEVKSKPGKAIPAKAVKSVTKPAAKPAPKVAPKAVAKPVAKASGKTPVKAATKVILKKPAKPVAKVVVKSAKPVLTKSAAKPVTKPVLKPIPKVAAKPAAKGNPQGASKPAHKLVPAPLAKVASKPAPKAPAKLPPISAAKPAIKPTAKPVIMPTAVSSSPAKSKVISTPVTSVTPVAAPVPAKAGRPSSRLAQVTVPSMAQSVASTAAKSSFSQSTPEPLISPMLPSAVKRDAKLANNWKTTPADQLSDAELIAMPDSEYMNDIQMAAFKVRLMRLKTDILASAGETTEHLREDSTVTPDPADRATIEEEHALELRTRDRERKLLKKIEQSIVRIDAGDYGYCDETGEAIGVGRLLARPTATLSLEAQQRRELKQKMFGD